MGEHRLSKRALPVELENVGQRGPGGKEKERTDCVAENRWVIDITGDLSTAALDPGAWYNLVSEEGCRFMAAWVGQ